MAASSYSGMRFTVFITALQILASLLFTYYLLDIGHQFLATAIILVYIVAVWRHPGVVSGSRTATYGVLLLMGLAGYGVLLLMGVTIGATDLLLGPNPIVLPLFASLFAFIALIYHGIDSSAGAAIGTRGVIVIVAVIALPILYFGGQFLLGGSWANAGGLIGEAGYGVGQAFGTVTEPVGEQLAYIQNRVLNPSRNRNLAQLSCAVKLLSGGGVFEVASGSAAMSECVENTIGGNESQARSERVTDPLEVQMGDFQIEPFSDHIRVSVPLTNTIVYDLQGVPIQMPARNVQMEIEWQYLDRVVARASDQAGQIPNGDTRQFDFESRDNGDPYFATFPVINGQFTDSALKTKLRQVREGEEEPNWFINRFESGTLSEERIVFLLSADEFTVVEEGTARSNICATNPEGLQDVCTYLQDAVGSGPGDRYFPYVLLQGKEYTVRADVTYEYSAEAAFTQSSRWKSGNQLLEVWTQESWQSMSFQDRQSWRKSKCGEVEKYGQTFTKQRTAALTTPVVPVMYTDCGISLFRNIESGTDNNIEITIGANVNEDSESLSLLNEDQGFKITAAETTCGGNNEVTQIMAEQRTGGLSSAWWSDKEGVGWTSDDQDTTIITRTVTVQGQRQSIACRTSMDITLNLQDSTSYEVPQIG